MSEWVWRSALADILKQDFAELNKDRLYRNMDRLYGKRGAIEEGFPKAHEIFAGNRSDSTTRDPF